ncbi:MAG: nodulation protein NfeD [Candidatus Eisenbacteria bacterium]|uniref:Nodulation protein NfeD n=1 Tax=Eiseniibacteriota bacterium TaxID=2212470 RepID=A0A538SII9_UNCEI|nr:MAG: nodulation protein NfeD [Candidatus Eisenbacteria bacterium]
MRGVASRLGARHGALAAGALALLALGAAHAAPRGEGRLLVVRLEGTVSPVMAEALSSAVGRAEREGYRAVVLEVDTPGGLESSMRDMVKRILSSQVPVLTWVAPSGARAASAGVFVVMAADIAAMAPGTNIGAATPISLQGPMDSTLARKATSDAAAFARTVAAQRGRSVEWAEQAVRRAVAASETEAVSLGVVDFVAATLPELLAKADGRKWRRGAETRTLRIRGLPADRIEPGLRQRALGILADPNIAYILLMLGFYGLLFELQNPGAILPGVVGGICLILAFFALSTLPVNTAGVALILLAIVFFLAEIKVHSHGLLAAGGVISLLLGSLFLFQGETTRLSWGLILGGTAATSAFFLFIVSAGLRAQRRRVLTGAAGLIGSHGVVVERLAPEGWVRLGDQRWNARGDSVIEAGTEVEITGLDRLTLRVRPAAKEAHS